MTPLTAAIGAVFGTLTLSVVVLHVRIELRESADRRAARALFLARPKAPIVKVGTHSRTPDGRIVLYNWSFDYRIPIPVYSAVSDGTHVYDVILGYTRDELIYIAAHPAEFEGTAR